MILVEEATRVRLQETMVKIRADLKNAADRVAKAQDGGISALKE